MASNAESALAHWQRIEGLLQEWLRERQQLLYLLCAIRGIRGLATREEPLEYRVQRFCEVLMDYISAGYFEVYRELAQEAHLFRRKNPQLSRSLMARLEESTDEALSFNDDFDTPEHIRELMDLLPQRLSRLMEKLEERFALEDQLIVSIHQRDVPAKALVH